MINPYGSATAVSSGWGDTDFPSNFFGVADELATGSGAAPTWTTSSGHATGSALAFNLGSSTGGGYTLAVGPNTVGSGVLGGAITQSIYYVPNIKGGANTVTVTFNQSAASPDVRILEYSGLSTSSPLDVTAAANGNGTAASSGSATTSSAAELIFGANTVYTSTKSAGTGFTSRIISPDGDIAEDENVSSAGSYSATATLSSSGNWVMQMAAFKAAATSGTSVYADVAYAPFGELYAASGNSDPSFTGQNQDMMTGLYDFQFRELHGAAQGRWISPDPAGTAAVDPMNPQTWNRYAYVANNPLSFVDPTGLIRTPWGTFPDGGGFGESWDEFDVVNIPIYGNTYGWIPVTSSTTGFSGAYFENSGDVTNLAYWGPLQVGTGFDLLGALWPGSINITYTTRWLTGRTPPNQQYRLVRTSDCFAPGDGVRSSTYSLQGSDASSAVITEHQLNPTMTYDNSGQSSQAGGIFQDTIGPNGSVGEKGSIRYFTGSINGQNLGVIPVVYGNGSTFAYEGIWFYGAQNPSNSQVIVNGSQADTLLSQGTCNQ